MSKSSITRVLLISVNEIDEEDEKELLESRDADDLEEVAEELSEELEQLLAHRVFGGADKIPLLDIETVVEDEYDENEYQDLRETVNE